MASRSLPLVRFKSLDYVSSFNVAGSARLVAARMIWRGPFNLKAEHGPSLFDARHRFVFSGRYEIPFTRSAINARPPVRLAVERDRRVLLRHALHCMTARTSLQGSSPKSLVYSSEPDRGLMPVPALLISG